MISSIMYTPRIQNFDFTANGFYSEFTSNPTITATASNLPQMQGSGLVRDLREATSGNRNAINSIALCAGSMLARCSNGLNGEGLRPCLQGYSYKARPSSFWLNGRHSRRIQMLRATGKIV